MNIFAVLAAFLLDFLTKAWAEKELIEGKMVTAIPEKLYFCRVKNFGIAGGALERHPELARDITVAVSALSVRYARKELKNAPAGVKFGFSLMLGGGLSNLAGRLKRGYVTDFIKFKKEKSFVFNAADLLIFTGCAIYTVFSLLQKKP